MKLTYDDVLIEPQFTDIKSRKDVDVSSSIGDFKLDIPVIAANMMDVVDHVSALAIHRAGAAAMIPRMGTIEDSISKYSKSQKTAIASIGVSYEEKERAEKFYTYGCRTICIDVAHGAQMQTVNMFKYLKDTYKDITIIVGNFATISSIKTFEFHAGAKADCYKVGIGPGGVCETRTVAGVGYPQLSAVIECASKRPIIADGGIRCAGDFAKAMAAGAKAVMVGSLFAGCLETPSANTGTFQGSAYKESEDNFKTSEGAKVNIIKKGSVVDVVKYLEGGLRSAMTYSNSRNLDEFKTNVLFQTVSNSTVLRNGAHYERN